MKIIKKIKTFFNTWKEQRENRKEQRRNKKYSRKLIKIENKQKKLSNISAKLEGSLKLRDKKKDRAYFDGWLQKRLEKNGGYLQDWYTRNKDFKASGFIGDKNINKKTIDKMEHDWNMKYNDFYKRGYQWAQREKQLAKNERERWTRLEDRNRKKWDRKVLRDIKLFEKKIEKYRKVGIDLFDKDAQKKFKALKDNYRKESKELSRESKKRYNTKYYKENKDKHIISYGHKQDNIFENEYLKKKIEEQNLEIKKLTNKIDEITNEKEKEKNKLQEEFNTIKSILEKIKEHYKNEFKDEEEKKEEQDYLPPKELPSNNGWEYNDNDEDITDEQIDSLLDDLYQEFKEDDIMNRILGDEDNFGRLFDIEGDSISSIINDIIQDSPLYEHYSIEEIEEMLINKYSLNSV